VNPWPVDDFITCWQCHGRSHDAWERRGKRTLLRCNYCGTGEWVYNAPDPPQDTVFRMTEGRFSGMSLEQIDKQPNGRRYLEHIRDTHATLREVVSRYLAALQ